jgi:hypothetical protein
MQHLPHLMAVFADSFIDGEHGPKLKDATKLELVALLKALQVSMTTIRIITFTRLLCDRHLCNSTEYRTRKNVGAIVSSQRLSPPTTLQTQYPAELQQCVAALAPEHQQVLAQAFAS